MRAPALRPRCARSSYYGSGWVGYPSAADPQAPAPWAMRCWTLRGYRAFYRTPGRSDQDRGRGRQLSLLPYVAEPGRRVQRAGAAGRRGGGAAGRRGGGAHERLVRAKRYAVPKMHHLAVLVTHKCTTQRPGDPASAAPRKIIFALN